MSFVPRLTSPVGTPRTTNWGLLGSPRRIIIHHTTDNTVPPTSSGIAYHFVVALNGTVHFGVNTTHRSGATSHNMDGSIMIAAAGNWHNPSSSMSSAQSNALTRIIADCLISFPSILRANRFDLPQQHISAIGNSRPAGFPRHSNQGIKGHDDGLSEATLCPGNHLYALCRDRLVPQAIALANNPPMQ